MLQPSRGGPGCEFRSEKEIWTLYSSYWTPLPTFTLRIRMVGLGRLFYLHTAAYL